MSRVKKASAKLTIRIDADLTRALDREARRRRKTSGLGAEGGNLIAQEARRQSLLVSGRRSESDTLDFIEQTADKTAAGNVAAASGGLR